MQETETEHSPNHIDLITRAYTLFNVRDIDSLLTIMSPDVKWPRAFEGDFAYGHDEVREYWTRQWKEINPNVTPVGFHQKSEGPIEVEVDQLVKDLEGNVLFDGKVKHIYTIKEGLIEKMEIES